MTHAGYAISTRTGGVLEQRIQRALGQLGLVIASHRDEAWEQAWSAANEAADLLAAGRRAKAGKVFAIARSVMEGRTSASENQEPA